MLSTIIVGGILVIMVFLALRYLIRNAKEGKCAGCSECGSYGKEGGCSHCSNHNNNK